MFEAVLVANRGEIALRVIRACRELGVRAVAVYSEADRDAPWLRLADQAFLLGPAAPSESYLHTGHILDVAARAGADAVHPGYGFLSESADFARAVTGAGLTWVGPPPPAIELMGDKLSARRAATAAGVPVVPGTMEPTTNPAVVRAFADEHGYPVAIKAAFGGGGRGLKVVREPAGLDDALEGARREAAASFGRAEVYVERYLPRPRHVEAQVLADRHGACLFLGERDCSTQRRHQKLIEEAPAPGVDDALRERIRRAAIRVARQVGYESAGTVELLMADGELWFLEMNTRLQVEHPVTELVTGVDLVAWQLRIAAGEPLSFTQDDVAVRGHAIEARINAEQVAAGFAPAPGLVTAWQPAAGPGVRVDAAAAAGWEVPRSYDSLVAKLITYGADRDEARRRMVRAIDEFVVEGVPTTLDFHRVALRHPDFVAGRMSTVSVEQEWDLSGIAAAPAPTDGAGPPEAPRTFVVEVDGKRLEIALFGTAPTGARGPRRRGTRPRGRSGAAVASEELVAPMQGTIVKTAVEAGSAVGAGDLVLVLEAMKMENHVFAHRAGVVTALHVAAGDVVNTGDPLARIADVPAAPADPPA